MLSLQAESGPVVGKSVVFFVINLNKALIDSAGFNLVLGERKEGSNLVLHISRHCAAQLQWVLG